MQPLIREDDAGRCGVEPAGGPERLLNRRNFAGLVAAGFGAIASVARRAVAGESRSRRESFLIYYGHAYDPVITCYEVVVLDPDMEGLARPNPPATCLGYMSLAEVHSTRSYYPDLAADGLILGESKGWPGTYLVDVRDARWQNRVLGSLVPSILAKGIHGLFLDTLDTAEFLEGADPIRYRGMVKAAADLVRAIRRSNLDTPIMINRGYEILPLISGSFDMLLGESVRATFVGSNSYRRVSDSDLAWQRDRMHAAKTRDPRLRLFSLDYWDPEDREGIAQIYYEAKRDGFIPYVGTPDLMRIVPPPYAVCR